MRKTLKILFVLFAIAVFCALLGNIWFEHKSSSKNSIKHAYAASVVYSLARNIGFSPEYAEKATISLGILNEIVEYPLKLGIFSDSGLEIVKDLHNNMMGIEAAKWLEKNKDKLTSESKLSLIKDLAEQKILILSKEEVLIKNPEKMKTKQFSNIFIAIRSFEENQNAISAKVNAYLE